ncbi:hypothetical protein LJC24_00720 [Desulfococcaceae bacterium OttesenSCG-928-F15]|nr:hypothetical protein [Desulfococcaceae bacterium OttesenSCG-928-F15]
MKLFSSIMIITGFICILPSSALAYLDPGTGSAILQGVIGALAATAIVLKLYWHKFLRLLGIRKKIEVQEISCKDESKKENTEETI